MRHKLGRSWRRVEGGTAADAERSAADVAQLLHLLHDTPEPSAPFSLHNLCAAPGVAGCAINHDFDGIAEDFSSEVALAFTVTCPLAS